MYQVAALGDTVYFGIAVNDTGGSATDGSSAVASVRLCGTGADVAPLVTVAGTLLSHSTYPAGAYEIAIAATEANGYAANQHYAVYATAAVDGENPIGHLGTFYLTAAGETPLLAAIRTLTALPNAAAGGASGLALHNGEMDLVDAPNGTAVTAIQNGLAAQTALDLVAIDAGAIKAKTDNLPALPAATDDIPTAAAIADAVLEEAVAGHKSVAGSLAAVLNAMWRRMGFGYIARSNAAKTIVTYDGTASTDTLLLTQTRTDTTEETDWTPR
jgi:hypothetical protein